jgi:hypothetical protein
MAIGVLSLSVFLLSAAIIYVLYCVNPNTDGSLSQVRVFILQKLPGRIQLVGDRVLGPRFSLFFQRLSNYLFFSNNSVVMICYLFIGPGCYLIYIVEVMVPYYDYINKLSLVAGNFVAWMAFFMYYKTYSTDPGVITPQNCEKYTSRFSSYYDGYLNVPEQQCRTCQTIKLSKKTSEIKALQIMQSMHFSNGSSLCVVR